MNNKLKERKRELKIDRESFYLQVFLFARFCLFSRVFFLSPPFIFRDGGVDASLKFEGKFFNGIESPAAKERFKE